MRVNWNQRIIGLIVGLLGPTIGFWGVVLYFDAVERIEFSRLWNLFLHNPNKQSAIISLSLIFNLFLFYAFLRLNMNSTAMGVVLGTMLYIPVVLYLKFLA